MAAALAHATLFFILFSCHSLSSTSYSFLDGNPKWDRTFLSYRFLNNSNIQVTSFYRDCIRKAFDSWTSDKFYFANVADYLDNSADITIGFYSGEHGDGDPFEDGGKTLAHSIGPGDSSCIHFNAQEDWVDGDGRDLDYYTHDLVSVAVHEIGHTLGLNHSSHKHAVMYKSIKAGHTKRNLDRDDLDGIHALYGN